MGRDDVRGRRGHRPQRPDARHGGGWQRRASLGTLPRGGAFPETPSSWRASRWRRYTRPMRHVSADSSASAWAVGPCSSSAAWPRPPGRTSRLSTRAPREPPTHRPRVPSSSCTAGSPASAPPGHVRRSRGSRPDHRRGSPPSLRAPRGWLTDHRATDGRPPDPPRPTPDGRARHHAPAPLRCRPVRLDSDALPPPPRHLPHPVDPAYPPLAGHRTPRPDPLRAPRLHPRPAPPLATRPPRLDCELRPPPAPLPPRLDPHSPGWAAALPSTRDARD